MEQVGGFDLIYRGNARVEPPANCRYRTYLGCQNNRKEQMKRLARALAAKREGQLNAGKDGNGQVVGGAGTGG